MTQLTSNPDQLRVAAMNVAAHTPFQPNDLARLAFYADGDESLMEDALGPSCEAGHCNLTAAEHTLSMRWLAQD